MLPSIQMRHAALWSSHCNSEAAKLIRLVNHYQRENERLARQNAELIADGERLDHLEKNHWLDVMGQNRKYLEFLGHASKTLRQAIDERRVQA